MVTSQWVAVVVTFLATVGVLAYSWADRRIDELGSEIRRLEAKSDAQTTRIDRLNERIEARQRTHA